MFAGAPFRCLCGNTPIYDKRFRLTCSGVTSEVSGLLLGQAPIIYADHIIDQMDVEFGDRPVGDYMLDAPSIRPPYDRLWIEAHVAVRRERRKVKLAVFATHGRLSDEQDLIHRGQCMAALNSRRAATSRGAEPMSSEAIAYAINLCRTADYVLLFPYVMGYLDERRTWFITGPIAMQTLFMTDLDQIARHPPREGAQPDPLIVSAVLDDRSPVEIESGLKLADVLYCHTVGLMHCSNVVVREAGEAAITDNKRLRRKHRLPTIRHHVLRVRVGTREIDISPNTETGTMPLHTVRGHYRKYGYDGRGLLFGKYRRSAVWVPPHVRGNADNGITTKDYDLEDDEAA